MDERVIRFRVGVVVLAAAAITSILIMLLGEGRAFFQTRYSIYLWFPQAPGVTVDTPVRKNGVLIGRVSDVTLQDEGGVLLTAWIDSQYKLRRDEVARIATSSLLGDAVLEFVPSGDVGRSNELIEDGDLLADGVVGSDPLRVLMNLEGDMRTTIQSIENAADNVSSLAENLNQTLQGDQDQFRRIVQKSELALDTLQSTMTTFDELLGDDELKAGLKQSLRDLPAVFQDVRDTMLKAQQTMASFEQVSSKAERNLDNLEAFTAPLAESGEAIIANIDSTVANLDEFVAQLSVFSQAVNNRDSSLGKLVHDDELYEQLRRTADNIEDATRRIRPILDDVRVFTNKIARDPRQLGVKGALDRRPLGTGLKSPFWESGQPLEVLR
jgi:phospholipid/cholesterol/gamma-HCH transport system substrate-binding protein